MSFFWLQFLFHLFNNMRMVASQVGSSRYSKKLAGKLLVRTLLPLGGLLLTAGIVLYLVNRSILIENVQAHYQTRTDRAVDRINNYIYQKKQLVRSIARSEPSLFNNRKKLKKYFERQKKVSKTYNVIMGFTDGGFVTSGNWQAPKSFDPRKRPWYKAALKADKLVVTKPYLSFPGRKLFATIAVPIKHNGKLIGVLGFDFKFRKLKPRVIRISRLSDVENLYVLFKDGSFIMHPDKSMVLAGNIDETEYGAAFERFTSSGQKNQIVESGDHTLFFGKVRTVNWYVAFAVPTSVVFSALNDTTLIYSLAIILTLLTLALVIRINSRDIIKPVQNLVAGARSVIDKKFTPISVISEDELGYLSETFNTMADSIKQYSENLETMVEVRTQELNTRNIELNEALGKIKHDQKMAQTVQEALISNEPLKNEKIAVAGSYLAMDSVGGDYFDVFELDDGRFGFVIADVSGHGTAAALITSMAKISFTNQSKRFLTPSDVMDAVNRTFYQTIGQLDSYVTAFYAIYDPRSGILQFTNAGHNGGYMVRNGYKPAFLSTENTFLGIVEDVDFKTRQLKCRPGDKLVLFTDGIVEARSADGTVYSESRFEDVLLKYQKHDVELFIEKIMAELIDFQLGADPDDDQALFVIELKRQTTERQTKVYETKTNPKAVAAGTGSV